ncbi:MAG: chemotaxis protein CheB [Ramlibacter sp.]|nr:chemotaxis protein CheB [Ramlibacter sp.]
MWSAHPHAIEAVALGASAGGVEALLQVLPGLPANCPASVLLVLHMPQERTSVLSDLLAARLALPVLEAADKQRVQAGAVHVAPPGYHLLVEDDRTLALNCDAPVLYSRPSIDVLMEAAADVWGPALAGILLTGANEDGAAGLARIKQAGGFTVVQDPAEAQAATMPLAALARHQPDAILPLAGIRTLLSQLAPHHAPTA